MFSPIDQNDFGDMQLMIPATQLVRLHLRVLPGRKDIFAFPQNFDTAKYNLIPFCEQAFSYDERRDRPSG